MVSFYIPDYGKEEEEAVLEVLRSGWVTTGSITEKFEDAFASYVGAKYCVLVNSCTAALRLSLEWLKKDRQIPDEFKALVPSLTFAATVNEIIHAGGKPQFSDVDIDLCMIPKEDGFDVALPVHITGNRAYTEYVKPVIEDSAHLIEQNHYLKSCFDNIICYSFYATKNLSMGEGGAICTNDSSCASWLRQARHHGISKGGWHRYTGGGWEYDIEFVGWKCNLSDLHAAIGLVQLSKLEDNNRRRDRLVQVYNRTFNYNHRGNHLYPILVRNREEFMKTMASKEIRCSVHFLPIHTMTAYQEYRNKWLPMTNYFGAHMVSLPLYPQLDHTTQETICQEVLSTNMLLDWPKSREEPALDLI